MIKKKEDKRGKGGREGRGEANSIWKLLFPTCDWYNMETEPAPELGGPMETMEGAGFWRTWIQRGATTQTQLQRTRSGCWWVHPCTLPW